MSQGKCCERGCVGVCHDPTQGEAHEGFLEEVSSSWGLDKEELCRWSE